MMVQANKASDIFWYYPNLIGFTRVVLSIASIFVFEDPLLFGVLYVSSFLLDAADGHVARMFQQCSRFGAVLDMVTDRFSTAALCVILGQLWPEHAKWLTVAIVLDISSHWVSMYASLLQGSKSHKASHSNWIMRLYYENRIVLGGVCLLNEFFYVALYLLHFFPSPDIANAPLSVDSIALATFYLCAPVYALKQYINIVQLANGCTKIVEWEYEHEISQQKE
jgi:CDP-diacylglycerol--inositol 3-phosphatidyltransferase